MSSAILTIDGEVERPLALSFDDLAAFSADDQVTDVSRLDAKRSGDAVTLNSLIARAAPAESATHVTLHASSDGFAASVPLADVLDQALIVYRLEGRPLPGEKGGPVRFLIPDAAACKTAELDSCANVKFVDRIELTAGKGRDTR